MRHVSVGVVLGDGLARRRGGAENRGVLVEAVRRVGVRRRVRRRADAVADAVVGVAVAVRPDNRGGKFRAAVIAKRARKDLVTRRDCFFGEQPVYWYETGYDLLARPTNAVDSAMLVCAYAHQPHTVASACSSEYT